MFSKISRFIQRIRTSGITEKQHNNEEGRKEMADVNRRIILHIVYIKFIF